MGADALKRKLSARTQAVQRLQREGRRLAIRFQKNNYSRNRFAFVVPVRVVPKAFLRNRLRRVLAAEVRKKNFLFSSGYDIVIVVKPGQRTAGRSSERDIRGELEALLQKIPA